eukprot:TRINITY_DN18912_c0_g2_i1.p1 TRINITY_DN18912_c0_g2~~TRINITY_DN18912_c0_g2_i1.p1  ORF type:complete len:428 (-),score=12.81 TRINITY_DN18912_c0_g2_i1:109-1392(-)
MVLIPTRSLVLGFFGWIAASTASLQDEVVLLQQKRSHTLQAPLPPFPPINKTVGCAINNSLDRTTMAQAQVRIPVLPKGGGYSFWCGPLCPWVMCIDAPPPPAICGCSWPLCYIDADPCQCYEDPKPKPVPTLPPLPPLPPFTPAPTQTTTTTTTTTKACPAGEDNVPCDAPLGGSNGPILLQPSPLERCFCCFPRQSRLPPINPPPEAPPQPPEWRRLKFSTPNFGAATPPQIFAAAAAQGLGIFDQRFPEFVPPEKRIPGSCDRQLAPENIVGLTWTDYNIRMGGPNGVLEFPAHGDTERVSEIQEYVARARVTSVNSVEVMVNGQVLDASAWVHSTDLHQLTAKVYPAFYDTRWTCVFDFGNQHAYYAVDERFLYALPLNKQKRTVTSVPFWSDARLCYYIDDTINPPDESYSLFFFTPIIRGR